MSEMTSGVEAADEKVEKICLDQTGHWVISCTDQLTKSLYTLAMLVLEACKNDSRRHLSSVQPGHQRASRRPRSMSVKNPSSLSKH